MWNDRFMKRLIIAAVSFLALASMLGNANPAVAGPRCGPHAHWVAGHFSHAGGHRHWVPGHCV
jgi:hypothetical protein